MVLFDVDFALGLVNSTRQVAVRHPGRALHPTQSHPRTHGYCFPSGYLFYGMYLRYLYFLFDGIYLRDFRLTSNLNNQTFSFLFILN